MQEPGDDYLRRIAAFMRANEKTLAAAQLARTRRSNDKAQAGAGSVFNPLSWMEYYTTVSTQPTPVVLTFDSHHLYYLLIRLEGIGIAVGTLDVPVENPSRPMNYINFSPKADRSDTMSLASIRSSLSIVSNLSLGAAWWRKAEPPSLDLELKYIYSSFTKLPALSIQPPGPKVIAELGDSHSTANAIPLDCFRNLQSLECVDVDPRVLLGWDLLAEGLRSLRIRKSGLEDISDIFIGAVLEDAECRKTGSSSRRTRSQRLPELASTGTPQLLPPGKWSILRFLSLSDNAMTFFPSELLPCLTSLTHLDLSSNLLVSVPPGLSALHNLTSLNLAHNMIDSVLGIYMNLGQVIFVNLAHNRLESLCGLERLLGLEKVDLRGNLVEESAEIGRLATLPNISQIWVEGNIFCEYEENYRTQCIGYFLKEGKSIFLDETQASYYEKQSLGTHRSPTPSTSIPIITTPINAAALSILPSQAPMPTSSGQRSPPLNEPIMHAQAKPHKRRAKRMIDLSEDSVGDSSQVHPIQVPDSTANTRVQDDMGPMRRHERHWSDISPSSLVHDVSSSVTPTSAVRRPVNSKNGTRRSSHGRYASASVDQPAHSDHGSSDLFRRRIENLKEDMGESWLKVYSQSQTSQPALSS